MSTIIDICIAKYEQLSLNNHQIPILSVLLALGKSFGFLLLVEIAKGHNGVNCSK